MPMEQKSLSEELVSMMAGKLKAQRDLINSKAVGSLTQANFFFFFFFFFSHVCSSFFYTDIDYLCYLALLHFYFQNTYFSNFQVLNY
jgi:hypothetical protein